MSPAALSAVSGTAAFNSELTDKDFAAISNLIGGMVGIQLSEAKRGLVKSRLQKRLRALNIDNFSDYVELVNSQEGTAELEELISAISTNVTAFNREPHHFEHFRSEMLPGLIKKIESGDCVRLWSAGCSNGSEPYTLACSVLEAFPSAGKYDFQILATDIDKYSLETGRKGVYSQEMVSKMPLDYTTKWFEETDQGFEIHPSAKELVSFKTLNLISAWPIKKKYDAIFCRNVMIYFSSEDQAKIITNFTKHLHPKAFLYIGHSERVIGPSASQLKAVGATTYQYDPGKK